VSVAVRLVTEPTAVVTTTAKVDPSSAVSAGRVVNVGPVTSVMPTPFQYHLYVAAVPPASAWTVNVVDWPGPTERSTGWTRMVGAVARLGSLEPQAARRERAKQTATRRMFKRSPKVIQLSAG
jgi:hypothetical protein